MMPSTTNPLVALSSARLRAMIEDIRTSADAVLEATGNLPTHADVPIDILTALVEDLLRERMRLQSARDGITVEFQPSELVGVQLLPTKPMWLRRCVCGSSAIWETEDEARKDAERHLHHGA